MANFAAVVDPDPERRTEFMGRVASTVRLTDRLTMGSLESGDLSVVWASAPSAPVDSYIRPDGAAALWGDALPPDGPRLDASGVFEAWTMAQRGAPSAVSGLYAAVVRFRDLILVGGDVLGLFPIYHWAGPGGVFIVASSPASIRSHSLFTPKRSTEGLAGILLTGGVVGGRTLWDGVVRLAPGHLLVRSAGSPPREVDQCVRSKIEGSGAASLDEAADHFDEALSRAVARCPRREDGYTLLLSGGRDSRLLAGALEGGRVPFRALTLGLPSDFEIPCARAVTRALRVDHRVAEVAEERFAELAELHVRTEALMGNLAGMHNWGLLDLIEDADGGIVTGHVLELVCGGVELEWAGASDSRDPDEDAFWTSVGRHAFSARELDALVGQPELRAAIRDTERDLRADFKTHGDEIGERARAYLFAHWGRCHAGAVPWRLSFARWPFVPVLDIDLLAAGATVGRVPQHPRDLQDLLLLRYHPRLARLPLVRASGTFEPLVEGWRWKLGAAFRRTSTRLKLDGFGGGTQAVERRRYRRLYDLDNVGWTAVRRRAEPYRERLYDLFRPEALDDFLPAPEHTLGLRRPIAESFARKTLIGLMLLSGLE